jgi:hypothetical protein
MALRPEDKHLAEANFPSLNASFYRGEPHAYLRTKAVNLVFFAARADVMYGSLSEGITYGGLEVGVDEQEADNPDEHAKFVTLEIEAIRHHAAETLLRLLLAHLALPPCPWLEISRLRSPNAFKSEVEAWLGNDVNTRLDDVRMLFLGSDERDRLPGVPDELWDDDCVRIVGWLERAADVVLKDAAVYNVVKHGLALQAGESALAYGEPDDGGGPIIRKEGPSLVYLSVGDGGPDGRQWQLSIRWVTFRQAFAEVNFYVRLIERLWAVARKRYTDEDGPIEIKAVLAFDLVRSAAQDGPGPYFVDDAHLSLLYYRPG